MFRLVLFVFIFAFFFIYITLLNPQPVHVKLYRNIEYTVPLSILIIISLTIGFVLSYLLNVIKDVYQGATLSSLKRRLSKQNEVKNKMAEAFLISQLFSPGAAETYLREKKLENDPFLNAFFGRLLRIRGDVEKAKELHVLSKKEAEDFSYPLYEFLMDLYQEKRFSELTSIVKELDKKLLSPLVLWVASDAAKEMGDYALAAAWGERLARTLKDERVRDYVLGLKVEELKVKKDTSGIRKILKKYPHFIPAILAVVDYGDLGYAMKSAKEAYKRTKDITYLVMLVDLMVKREGVDPSKTIEFVKSMAFKEDKKASLVLAYLYAQVGMYDEAVKILSEISDIEDTVFANFVRAKIFRGLKKYEECCSEMEKVLEETGLSYRCKICGEIYSELAPFCKKCKNYNSIKAEVG